MSMLLMVKVMGMKIGHPIKKLVLLKLADNANDQGECWPSYAHIADQCEVAKSTVRKHMKELEEAGLIRIENRKGPKGNASNLYHLMLHPMPSGSTGYAATEHTPMPSGSTGTSHIEPVNESLSYIKPKVCTLEWGDTQLTEQQKDDIKGIRQACKKKLTQLALNTILKELDLAKNNYGIDYQESIEIWAVRGWTGFKAEWAANHKGVNQNKQTNTINNLINAQLPDLGDNHGQPNTIQAINGGAVIGLPESNDTGNDSNVLDGTWELQP